MAQADLGFLIVPGLIWWIALAAAVAAGVWAYWRLPAPLNRFERVVLHTLRIAALVVLLLLMIEPLLTLRGGDSGRPRLAVLVDRSSSMSLPAHGEQTRAQQAARTLQAIEEQLGGRFAIDVYGFAGDIERRRDEEQGLPWRPLGATAMGDALEEVVLRQGEGSLGAIVLLSDGIHTSGKDPLRIARNLPVPVYAVLLGDTSALPDLQLREVRAQPLGHVGEPVALRAWLQSEGLAGWNAEVSLRERSGEGLGFPGAEIDRQTLTLAGEGEIETRLETVPRHAGLTLYEVTATTGGGESVSVNNRRLVAVDVRDKRTRVLVVEGEPDWDFSFLKRTFDADTTLSYTYFVRGKDGRFLGYGEDARQGLPSARSALKPFAAVIVGRLGPADLPAGFASALREHVLQGGGALFLGAPLREGADKWAEQGWGDLLPVSVAPQRRWGYLASACSPTFQGLTHEVGALADSPGESERIWRSFPPLWIQEGEYRTAAGATVLFTGRAAHPERDVPLVAIASAGAGRIATVSARGFWRWDFVMRSQESEVRAAREFWMRLARWLTEPSEQEHLAVHPVRPVFQDSEPVGFSARLLDDSFQPIATARVELTIESEARGMASDSSASAAGIPEAVPSSPPSAPQAVGEGRTATGRIAERTPVRMSLFPEGAAGRYAGTLAPLPPGAYRYAAEARDAGDLGARRWTAEGRFWVEEMGPEFYRLSSSSRLLERLAESSGGAYRNAAQVDELLSAIPEGYRRTPVVKQAEIWNHWAVFAFLAAVLSLEWIWRRRRGLA